MICLEVWCTNDGLVLVDIGDDVVDLPEGTRYGLSIWQNTGGRQRRIGTEVLEQYGIREIDPQRHYSFRIRRSIHATVLKRFGLVTTNSITQVFQRRVMERHLNAKAPVSLIMAIPDHPWTKATRDAAAVRMHN